jgi:hypothetical protein
MKHRRVLISFLEIRRNYKWLYEVSEDNTAGLRVLLLAFEQKTHKRRDPPRVQVLPFQFAGMFHTRHLTCHQSLKWYLSDSVEDFTNFYLHILICVICGDTIWKLSIHNRIFPTSKEIKTHNRQCLIHGIVTECCFEHFMLLRCSFPELHAKLNTYTLFLEISHYYISDCTCKNSKQLLRINASVVAAKLRLNR